MIPAPDVTTLQSSLLAALLVVGGVTLLFIASAPRPWSSLLIVLAVLAVFTLGILYAPAFVAYMIPLEPS